MREKDLLSELSEIRRTFEEFFVSKNPLMMMCDPYWRPPMDVFDTEDYTLVRLEIAGMKREEIEVLVENNYLVIRGERRDEMDRKFPARCYRQMEIKYAAFRREVLLPRPFLENRIVASYRNGFLEVRVPVRKGRSRPVKTKIAVREVV